MSKLKKSFILFLVFCTAILSGCYSAYYETKTNEEIIITPSPINFPSPSPQLINPITLELSIGNLTGDYFGESKNALPDGFGTFTYSGDGNEIIYSGEWIDGHFDGSGYLKYNNSISNQNYQYEGTWIEDNLINGVLSINQKKVYEGAFTNYKCNGEGTLYNEDGSVIYTGQFSDGMAVDLSKYAINFYISYVENILFNKYIINFYINDNYYTNITQDQTQVFSLNLPLGIYKLKIVENENPSNFDEFLLVATNDLLYSLDIKAKWEGIRFTYGGKGYLDFYDTYSERYGIITEKADDKTSLEIEISKYVKSPTLVKNIYDSFEICGITSIKDFKEESPWISGNKYSFSSNKGSFLLYTFDDIVVNIRDTYQENIYLNGKYNENYTPSTSFNLDKLIEFSKQKVTSYLKYPNTAKFPVFDWKWSKSATYMDIVYVSSYVSAENELGYMVKTNFKIGYQKTEDSYKVVYFILAGTTYVNDIPAPEYEESEDIFLIEALEDRRMSDYFSNLVVIDDENVEPNGITTWNYTVNKIFDFQTLSTDINDSLDNCTNVTLNIIRDNETLNTSVAIFDIAKGATLIGNPKNVCFDLLNPVSMQIGDTISINFNSLTVVVIPGSFRINNILVISDVYEE